MIKTKNKIGFIGLGLMGRPMALNILKSGFPLVVYNRNEAKTREFKRLGAVVAHSPFEVGEKSDIVITMITGPKDVRQVLLGKRGVAENCASSPIVIDMSTIGPTAANEIAQDLKTCGIHFIDAPVTGGTVGAEAGKLTIFIGGDKMIVEKVRPVLEVLGTDLQYIGKTGMGQSAKLINNLIVGETIAALSEGFLLADKLGLSRKKMMEALQNVFALSPNMKAKMPNMVNRKYPVSFSIANIRKDLHLAQIELSDPKILPLLKNSEKLYNIGIKNGFGDEDLSAVIKVLEEEQ